MSRLTSSVGTRQGKSPTRSNVRSSVQTRRNLANSPPKAALASPRQRKNDSILIERDQGIKNTPQHLHGLDDSGDFIDKIDLLQSNVQNKNQNSNPQCEEPNKNSQKILQESMSWRKTLLLIICIAAVIQAFLWLKSKPDPFQDMKIGDDATVCLRSYDELRKKLALAFELITESGKLFKQLERQTKYQQEQIEMKHNSLENKATSEIEKLRKQLAMIQEMKSHKDNIDFSRFSEKEYPVDLSEMHSLIEIALERYDADKIGIPDYALESAGARIHVPYHSTTHSSGWPIMKVFGIVVWQDTRTPREIIKPENLPGNCWPFEGQKGFVVIKLATRIIPSMVTMEHLHQSLARFSDDTLKSMPKNFSVYSWKDENGREKTLLGSYIYNQHGKARQTFPIQLTPETAVEYVELRIESNYGNKDFTCIYRFRMHGEPENVAKSNSDDS